MNENMAAACGTYCGVCEWKDKFHCPGCKACKGKPFWGECNKARCCLDNGFENCGSCPKLPCDKLQALFDDPEHGDKGARMKNLENWSKGIMTFEKLREAVDKGNKN